MGLKQRQREAYNTNTRGKATAVLIIAQILFVVLFGLFVDYAPTASQQTNNTHHDPEHVKLESLYPMFQDIHVMILIGFGFLMTFLAHHGFGSVGFNFMLTCFVIEWATLINGYFKMIGTGNNRILLDITSFMEADFAVATVLISFGALLGKTSPVQLLVMATLEVIFYNISIYVGVGIFKAIDVGGSIFLHAFGAYFGLSVSRVLYKKAQTQSSKETSIYHSDIFAMIGTIFLWLYWPSFNAGPAADNERHRAVINTILSLSSCTVMTFALSSIVNKDNKLDMVHVQNATLAGGVIMGASADLMIQPFGSLIAGMVAATVSTLGYKYLQPILTEKAKIHDTCGVNNLHGMPGILGAVLSAIVCAAATRETYEKSYDELFPDSRSGTTQGGYQIAALVVALAIALVGGTLTGFLLKMLPGLFDALDENDYYDDAVFWDAVDDQPSILNETIPEPLQARTSKEDEAMAQEQQI
uniref:ammonium transporter Rh type B-like isoform X1 n=1 Tax=Styela clava TaxID=7725 RepID=UPI001939E357|nr:ammonium transporter Rh type B-like isoform X1 [Styela clava]